MKILHIIRNETSEQEMVLKCEPPLTPQVFAEFRNVALKRNLHPDQFEYREGNLVVKAPPLADLRRQLDAALTIAEGALEKKQNADTEKREAMLRGWSNHTDIPLE